MGRRGRKPVEVQLLKGHAVQWASLLYALRDGRPGLLEKVEWGPYEEIGTGKSTVTGRRAKSVEVIFQAITANSKEHAKVERMMKLQNERENYKYSRPLAGQPRIWEQLKAAKRLDEIEDAIRKIRRWGVSLRHLRRFTVSLSNQYATYMGTPGEVVSASKIRGVLESRKGFVAWHLLPPAFASGWAAELLKARNLWNYPRSDRPQSDDRRIQFFAKALAGLTLGIAPATATKRLAHWRWPKDWGTRREQL